MPATRPRPSARELLGGRWALSLRGWLIFSVLLVLAGMPSLIGGLGLPPRTAVALTLAGWLLTAILFLGAHLTVFRNRRTRPVHIAWLIALGALAGLARAGVVLAVPESRDVFGEGWSGFPTAALYFVPSSVTMVVLITYLVAVSDWYATERTRLLRFEIDAEAARLRAVGALNAARAVITTRIQTALEDQLGELERAAKVDSTDAGLSDALLDTAAGYVRPESHRLWQERTPGPRRGTLMSIEHASLSAPLPIVLPYVLWAVIGIPVAAVSYGGVRWIPGAVAELAAMAVLYPLGRAAIRRYAPAPRYMRARLLALAFMVPAALAGPATFALLRSTATPALRPVLTAAVIVTLTIVVSWAQAALRVQDTQLQTLRDQAEEAEFERLALEAATEQMQRELALYLHGTVQAGLVAAAYSLQDAAQRGDQVALERAIADARATAAQVSAHPSRPFSGDLADKRGEIDDTWQGMLALRWSLPTVQLDAALVERIGNVVQECLANASIHGAATEATVRIALADEQVIVEITDNGSGPGDGQPGLGSAVLNEATHGQWTIAAVPTGGTQVRAILDR